MAFLTEAEQKRVAEAVAAAEKKTGGEIVTAIIPESDDYGFRELLVAIVIGVMVWMTVVAFPAPLEVVLGRLFWEWQPWMLAFLQGAVGMTIGLVAYLVVQIPAVDRLILSRRMMQEAVARRARRHFMESGACDTVDRTGVLLFISLLERRVELIADRGINERVAPERWQAIVVALTEGIRGKRTADALVEAVQACGAILEGQVERRVNDTNELDDRPIELEKGS